MAIHCYYQTFFALMITFSMINVNLIQSASIPDACLNYCSSGYCYESNVGPKCVCVPRWTGERCDISQNDIFVDQGNGTQVGVTLRSYLCKQLPADFCKNGGVCYLNGAKLACQCPYLFSGDYCETQKIDPCQNFCYNGATCEVDADDEATCPDCPEGWTGSRCQKPAPTTTTPITTTEVGPVCAALGEGYCNSGTCYPSDGKLCLCPPTHTGDRCQTPVNGGSNGQITTAPTRPGQPSTVPGTSITNAPGTSITNAPGVTCAQQPCGSGRCFPQGSSYVCVCPNGSTGASCGGQG